MGRTDTTEKDVLTWTLAGCNAAEVAAYTRTSEAVAQARMNRALRRYAKVEPHVPLQLARKHA